MRGLPRLDRYLLSEVAGPLGLGLMVYTFILLVQFLFRSAELIIRRGLSVWVVGEMLLYSLPNIIALTIPMALLFGVLVAVGRLSSDSELIALRSSGVGLGRLFRPILMLGVLLAAATAVVVVWLLPAGNHALVQTQIEATARSAARQIEPRVFSEDWESKVLYVFETDAAGWRGVFVADSVPGDVTEVTVASRGDVRVDAAGERVSLHLEEAVTHKVRLSRPDRYEATFSRSVDQLLEDQFFTEQRARITQRKGLREMSMTELSREASDPKRDIEQRRRARTEWHKKLSIPAACVVFAVLGLPLGFNNRRGGKSSGFALSIGIIVLYYLMLNNGEKAARFGNVAPWMAAWAPNLLLLGLGLALAARRNRDRPILPPNWLGGLGAWRRRRRARRGELRRAAAGARAARVPGRLRLAPRILVRLPRLRLAFPNLLDRYVLRVFASHFGLVTLSAVSIYVIADFGQIVDEIFKHQIPGDVVARYYRYFSLQIFYDVAPILVLVTTLVTFGLLARTNEVTAAKALGVSLLRLGAPALVAAGLVSVLCAFLQAQVLPASNEKVAQLRERIYGRPPMRTFRRADRQWLFGQGRYIYNYRQYDEARRILTRLQVFEFDEQARLVRRLYTETARWVDGRWVFDGLWMRSFDGATVTGFETRPGPVVVDYPETPEYFQSEIKRPELMRYGELRAYTRELRDGGQPAQAMEVELHAKIAFPAVALVMGLVALPFAFRLGKQGALYGLGLSVILGMVYLIVFAFFRTLGQTGALPALIAVWSPSLLFGFLSAYLFLGVRS